MSCIKSITTSSGTFSISDEKMTRCEAKKYCRDKGQILAPITTQKDKDAVVKMINPYCLSNNGEGFLHIGLDVFPCGDKQYRVFTNGIEFDPKIHGHLYADLSEVDDKCPQAYFERISTKTLKIGIKPWCYPQKHKALCLDQSTATASGITQKEADHYKVSSTQAVIVIGGFLFVLIGCLVVIVKLYKSKNKLEKKFFDLEM